MTHTNWIRTSRRTAWLGAAALLAFGLTACDGPTGGETTSLSLQLTDHPSGDVEAAWLQVDSVQFQGSGGSVTVMDTPGDYIKVSELQAEEDEFEPLVEGVEVPSGTYTQVRVFLGGAAIQSSADGDIFTFGEVPPEITGMDPDGSAGTEELVAPSIDQTGIKAILGGEPLQLEGPQMVLAIDFDVSQSFGLQAGRSGSWVLHPVMEILDLETTGRIEGEIVDDDDPTVAFDACDGNTVTVEDFEPLAVNTVAPEDTATGTVDPDSSYAILTAAGTYEITYEEQVEFDNGATVVFGATPTVDGPVELAEGAVETVNFELDEVTCQPSSG